MRLYIFPLLWVAVAGGPAVAGTLSFANTTPLVAYSGTAPAPFFSGANPYVGTSAIGSDFTTSTLTLQATPAASGSVSISMTYLSQFSGTETVGGQTVAAADIFLQPAGTNGFSYAIAMGAQANGLAAGFYTVLSDETSQQVWSARPGFIYGGAVASSTAYLPGQPGYSAMPMPTVLTAGTRLSGALITTVAEGQGWYAWNIAVTLAAGDVAVFDHGFDIFWGTADCANGAFLVDVPPLPVREPASTLTLVTALTWLSLVRFKTRLLH
jgi:hypothetical protein